MGVYKILKRIAFDFVNRDITKQLEKPFRSMLLFFIIYGIVLLMATFVFSFDVYGQNLPEKFLHLLPAHAILVSALIAGFSIQYSLAENRKSKEREMKDKKAKANAIAIFYFKSLKEELETQRVFLQDICYVADFVTFEEYCSNVKGLFYSDMLKKNILDDLNSLNDKEVLAHVSEELLNKILIFRREAFMLIHYFDILQEMLRRIDYKKYMRIYKNIEKSVDETLPAITETIREYEAGMVW